MLVRPRRRKMRNTSAALPVGFSTDRLRLARLSAEPLLPPRPPATGGEGWGEGGVRAILRVSPPHPGEGSAGIDRPRSASAARQRATVHVVVIHREVAQHGRRDVGERAWLQPWAGGEAAALDQEERPLLVGAEPAMLAEADLALVVGGVLHD